MGSEVKLVIVPKHGRERMEIYSSEGQGGDAGDIDISPGVVPYPRGTTERGWRGRVSPNKSRSF